MDRAVQDLMSESNDDPTVPTMDSRADVYRKLVDYALKHAEIAEIISDELRILSNRDEFVESEARLRSLRTGFEKRAKEEIEKRWKAGMEPEQIREYAENYHREVDILFPGWTDVDHSRRRQKLHTYVSHLCDEAVQAQETSTWDPLDPDEVFSHYEGVQEADEEVVENVQEMADDRAREIRQENPDLAGTTLRRKLEREGFSPAVAATAAGNAPPRERHSYSPEATGDD